MASTDGIRAVKKAGEPSSALERIFKDYVLAHPLHSDFVLEIKDLERDFGVDLSWYPVQDQLAYPGEGDKEAGTEAEVKVKAGEGTRAEAGAEAEVGEAPGAEAGTAAGADP